MIWNDVNIWLLNRCKYLAALDPFYCRSWTCPAIQRVLVEGLFPTGHVERWKLVFIDFQMVALARNTKEQEYIELNSAEQRLRCDLVHPVALERFQFYNSGFPVRVSDGLWMLDVFPNAFRQNRILAKSLGCLLDRPIISITSDYFLITPPLQHFYSAFFMLFGCA